MYTLFTPFEHIEPSHVLDPIRYLDAEALLSQLEEPVLLRLAMMTPKQLCKLHGVGPVTASRIQLQLNKWLYVGPRRNDESTLEWLVRNFNVPTLHQLSIRLLYQVNVFSPAHVSINAYSTKEVVEYVLKAFKADDMSMGELAHYDFAVFDNHIEDYLRNNGHDVETYVGALQTIMFFGSALREWGVSTSPGLLNAARRIGAPDLALAK